MSIELFEKKMFLWIFSWLSVIDRKNTAFKKTFSPGLTELVSTCRKKNIEAQLIFKKSLYFILFRTSIELFPVLSKIFWWGCQNCLLRFHSNILKKKCLNFSDVGQKTTGILWQTFRQVVKNCFLGVHGNNLSRKTFRWKPYIFLFRHWAENFHFVRKFFDWVVRTAVQLAIGLFWEEVSSLSFRLSFSDIEPKFFGILWIVFQLGCQNCILRVQKDSLSWISFAKVVEFCLSLSDFQTKKSCFLAEK